MTHTDQTLRVERGDDRVVATLDRPAVRNAIDQELVDRLHELCGELEASPRTLILTGASGVFAAGADIAQLLQRRAADARAGINTRVFDRIAALPMPVVAAIDGFALGGGAELAYAADLRIGTGRMRIGNPETGLGIIAAAGATWRLPRRCTSRMRCCRRPMRSPTGSPGTTRSRPATPRPRCTRPSTRIRRSSWSCRPSCSRARRRSAG
mgnify:CR=1 FL=1